MFPLRPCGTLSIKVAMLPRGVEGGSARARPNLWPVTHRMMQSPTIWTICSTGWMMRLLLPAGGGHRSADAAQWVRRGGAVCHVEHLAVDREVMGATGGSMAAHGSDGRMDRLLPVVVVGLLRGVRGDRRENHKGGNQRGITVTMTRMLILGGMATRSTLAMMGGWRMSLPIKTTKRRIPMLRLRRRMPRRKALMSTKLMLMRRRARILLWQWNKIMKQKRQLHHPSSLVHALVDSPDDFQPSRPVPRRQRKPRRRSYWKLKN
mmetsp:Transcript_34420/g.61827  ORF Transcript_34420/g.61827 Transcript_34420/m.61827 type:complete len:263 (-) Transcript_34420:4024-4812(-)